MASKSRAVHAKRKNTLKKKAQELSTLCGIPVCLISDNADDHLDSWPQNQDDVSLTLTNYYKDRHDMLREIYETNMGAYSSWDSDIDYGRSGYSVDGIIKHVNDTIKKIEEKELAGSSYLDDEEAEAKEVAECSCQGGDEVDSGQEEEEEEEEDGEEEEDDDDDDGDDEDDYSGGGGDADTEQPKDDEEGTDRKEHGLDSATTNSDDEML